MKRPTIIDLELEDLPDSHTQTRKYIEYLEEKILLDQLVEANAMTDTKRIDWLADSENVIGNVMLPSICVENGLVDGLRGAIDEAMKLQIELILDS